MRAGDIVWVLAGNALLIVAMWIRHGGLDQLNTIGGVLTAIGQLTGLLGAYLALLQLVLMSRSPWLDQVFGMDRLAWAHRWLGFATVWLITAHGLFTIGGYSLGDGQTFLGEAWLILTTYAWVLPATIGFVIFVAIVLFINNAAGDGRPSPAPFGCSPPSPAVVEKTVVQLVPSFDVWIE